MLPDSRFYCENVGSRQTQDWCRKVVTLDKVCVWSDFTFLTDMKQSSGPLSQVIHVAGKTL